MAKFYQNSLEIYDGKDTIYKKQKNNFEHQQSTESFIISSK